MASLNECQLSLFREDVKEKVKDCESKSKRVKVVDVEGTVMLGVESGYPW